jgi:hypothetical protein
MLPCGSPPWPWLALAELASVACEWALGPTRHWPWVDLIPVKKGSCAVNLLLEKLLQDSKSCKMHILFPVYQKNMNYISKCSEK